MTRILISSTIKFGAVHKSDFRKGLAYTAALIDSQRPTYLMIPQKDLVELQPQNCEGGVEAMFFEVPVILVKKEGSLFAQVGKQAFEQIFVFDKDGFEHDIDAADEVDQEAIAKLSIQV